MKRRRFTQDFKRSVVEQLLSETAGPAEICRRYNLSSGQLYTWKRQYADGKLDPAAVAARLASAGRRSTAVNLAKGPRYRNSHPALPGSGARCAPGTSPIKAAIRPALSPRAR